MSKVINELKESSDPIDVDLAAVLEHWQSSKRKNGFPARLGYEPRDIKTLGAKGVISSRVLNASTGFDEVDPDQSYEAIVLRYPKEFSAEVVAAAKYRTRSRSYWWVNHKQTFAQEVGGGYLWSPLTRNDGAINEFYENMHRTQPGDIVFSFADAKVQAVGICTAPALLTPRPIEFGAAGINWSDEGWKVTVDFVKLDAPLRPKDHMKILAPLLPQKYSPIRSSGDGNQGAYLAKIPREMAQALANLMGRKWPSSYFQSTELSVDASDVLEEVEASAENAIRNRADLTETEKLALVRSRRGQGIYRKNLEGYEKQCRVTGVSNPRHLRASHIKPWRASNNFEKLDGNNGFLLSPHIDHLFDRGYISFTDEGDILVSSLADRNTIERWEIDLSINVGSFRPEQLPYLAFHRESIFMK